MIKPVVLVTGGGSGIGAGLVARLAGAGWQVVSTGRRQAALEAVAAEVAGSVEPLSCDITDGSSVAGLMREIAGRFGQLDALINNAGQTVIGPFRDAALADLEQLVDVNLIGTLRVTHQALPLFSPEGGSILNMGSTLASHNQPGTTTYAASKGAIESLTRGLALELGPNAHIRVNCIRPSVVRSEIMTSAGMSPEAYENLMEVRGGGYPLGRIGEPADIAHMAEFLLSDKAQWITGAIFDVDGGYSAWGH